jgi:hypothetical protein
MKNHINRKHENGCKTNVSKKQGTEVERINAEPEIHYKQTHNENNCIKLL